MAPVIDHQSRLSSQVDWSTVIGWLAKRGDEAARDALRLMLGLMLSVVVVGVLAQVKFDVQLQPSDLVPDPNLEPVAPGIMVIMTVVALGIFSRAVVMPVIRSLNNLTESQLDSASDRAKLLPFFLVFIVMLWSCSNLNYNVPDDTFESPGHSQSDLVLTSYIVQPGDTLSAIAQRFGMTLGELLVANPEIINPDTIAVGQKISVPPTLSE